MLSISCLTQSRYDELVLLQSVFDPYRVALIVSYQLLTGRFKNCLNIFYGLLKQDSLRNELETLIIRFIKAAHISGPKDYSIERRKVYTVR